MGALNCIEIAIAAEKNKQNLDYVLSQVMSNTMNQRPLLPCRNNDTQEEQQQQQQQHQQPTEESISARGASSCSASGDASYAWRDGGSANQENMLQEGAGTLPAPSASVEVQ